MTRNLPDWIDAFMDYTANTEPSPLYKKWSAISCIASALQRKCFVRMGDALTHYPNLYIILVGPPSARKGTAMAPALDFLRDSRFSELKIAANSTTLAALVGAMERSESTYQNANGDIVSHSSLSVFSTEFTVFLGFKNSDLIQTLTDWYDCHETWRKETRHVGDNFVRGVCMNLLAATTPKLIQSQLPAEAIGGGFTSRIVFVYASRKADTISFPSYKREIEEQMLDDLEQIHSLNGEFEIDSEVLFAYDEWYKSSEAKQRFKDEKFAHYFERKPAILMKVAMIHSASRSNEMILRKIDFDEAIQTMIEVEGPMQFSLSGIGQSPYVETLTKIMTEISMKKTMTSTEIMAKYMEDITSIQLDEILTILSRAKYITHFVNTGEIIWIDKEK